MLLERIPQTEEKKYRCGFGWSFVPLSSSPAKHRHGCINALNGRTKQKEKKREVVIPFLTFGVVISKSTLSVGWTWRFLLCR